MWNNRERLMRERLMKVKRFVLAVDDDAAGKRLHDEIVRRLLASRCMMVRYPLGCKDANQVLKVDGKTAIMLGTNITLLAAKCFAVAPQNGPTLVSVCFFA
jgi:Toprim-like